jgi:hypothetical protein
VRFRSEVGAELAPLRRWSFSVSERALFGARLDNVGRWQTLLGATWSPRRWLDVGFGYRLSAEVFDDDGIGLTHRFHVQVALTARWRSLRLLYRVRPQVTLADDEGTLAANPYLRNRVGLRWRATKHLQFTGTFEVFSDITGTPHPLDRARTEAWASGEIGSFELSAGYRFDGPVQGDGKPYHMIMASVVWHWSSTETRERRGGGS